MQGNEKKRIFSELERGHRIWIQTAISIIIIYAIVILIYVIKSGFPIEERAKIDQMIENMCYGEANSIQENNLISELEITFEKLENNVLIVKSPKRGTLVYPLKDNDILNLLMGEEAYGYDFKGVKEEKLHYFSTFFYFIWHFMAAILLSMGLILFSTWGYLTEKEEDDEDENKLVKEFEKEVLNN